MVHRELDKAALGIRDSDRRLASGQSEFSEASGGSGCPRRRGRRCGTGEGNWVWKLGLGSWVWGQVYIIHFSRNGWAAPYEAARYGWGRAGEETVDFLDRRGYTVRVAWRQGLSPASSDFILAVGPAFTPSELVFLLQAWHAASRWTRLRFPFSI